MYTISLHPTEEGTNTIDRTSLVINSLRSGSKVCPILVSPFFSQYAAQFLRRWFFENCTNRLDKNFLEIVLFHG